MSVYVCMCAGEEMRFAGQLKQLTPSDLQKKRFNVDVKKRRPGEVTFSSSPSGEHLFLTLHSNKMQMAGNSISKYSRV